MRLDLDARKGQVPVTLWLGAGMVLAGGAAAEIGTLGDERPPQPALQQSRDRLKVGVGWHDEMNEPGRWQPAGAGIEPDVFSARRGRVTLRLPHVPEGFPHAYQWGGVTRRADVDLGRYPVLVAYVSGVREGSYAHLDLEERDYGGRPVRALRTPTLRGPGLTVLDVGREWGPETRRMHLRLIVGGPLSGASCEYSWVRFVRREDVPRLEADLAARKVELKP